MTFRRSNQKPRTKKSHVMEQIFLSPVKNTKNSQRIRENKLLHDISEILLKVALNTITLFKTSYLFHDFHSSFRQDHNHNRHRHLQKHLSLFTNLFYHH